MSIQFGLAPTTVNQNYNEAIKYHKLRKCKKSKKTDKSANPEGDEEEEKETSKTSEEFSDEEIEVQGEIIVEAEKEITAGAQVGAHQANTAPSERIESRSAKILRSLFEG